MYKHDKMTFKKAAGMIRDAFGRKGARE